MTRDFFEYEEQRRRECDDLGLPHDELTFWLEPNTGYGQVHGPIHLLSTPTIEARLDIRELVLIEDGHARRVEYGYFLIINREEIWGHERDPAHVGIEVHKHTRRHRDRIPSERITFQAAVQLAWDHVTHCHEHGLTDDYDPLAD